MGNGNFLVLAVATALVGCGRYPVSSSNGIRGSDNSPYLSPRNDPKQAVPGDPAVAAAPRRWTAVKSCDQAQPTTVEMSASTPLEALKQEFVGQWLACKAYGTPMWQSAGMEVMPDMTIHLLNQDKSGTLVWQRSEPELALSLHLEAASVYPRYQTVFADRDEGGGDGGDARFSQDGSTLYEDWTAGDTTWIRVVP
jgi:hypothetical protein